MKPNDGGPAFPTIQTGHNAGIEFTYTQDGMSQRALFAVIAMNGIVSSGRVMNIDGKPAKKQKEIAEASVLLADALIEELEKET
jgi:hypothetical protein